MARILIIEDEEKFREEARRELEAAGHTIVQEATTLTEAKQAVRGLERMNVDIVILDGNLMSGSGAGADGSALARQIHYQQETMPIILWSRINYGYGDTYVEKLDNQPNTTLLLNAIRVYIAQ